MDALRVIILAIAFQHVFFLVLEMFLWRKPLGRKVFRTQPDFADKSAALAANQGLYNGFLAAGLAWSLIATDPMVAKSLQVFFLSCVAVAGAFGGATVNRRIFLLQGIPALLALLGVVYLAQ